MVNKKEYNKEYYLKNREKILKRRKERYYKNKEKKEKVEKILKDKKIKKPIKNKRIRKQITLNPKMPEHIVRKKEKELAEKVANKKLNNYLEISTIIQFRARNKLIIKYSSENEEGEELKAKTISDSLIGVRDLEILKRQINTIIEEGEELTDTEISRIVGRIENETGFKGIFLKTAKDKGTVKIKKIRIQTNIERTKDWRI